MLWGTDHIPVVYDLPSEILRPYIPIVYRKRIFYMFLKSFHPSA